MPAYIDERSGLRMVDEPYANGIAARAVFRGDERIYHDTPAAARHFVQGYTAAKREPIHLVTDPRFSDIDILNAARELLEERGQDTENLQSAVWSIKAATCVNRARECPTCDGHGAVLLEGASGSDWCQECKGSGYVTEGNE